MYGRGNYVPQFGQGLQRPMPPYQQHLLGDPSPHFPQGGPVSRPPMIQQPGSLHPVQPRGSAYPHAPPAPPTIVGNGTLLSSSNAGRPSLTVHSGAPSQHPYSAAQPFFSSGVPPPPPPLIVPRVLPPPPSRGPEAYGPPLPQPSLGIQHGIHHIPLPPPPPHPAANFFRPANFESATIPLTESQMPSMAPHPPPLPPSSPPKPPPPPSPVSQSSSAKISTPMDVVATSPVHSDSKPSADKVPVFESTGNFAAHSQNRGDTPISDEDLSLSQNVVVDLPSPPPKPTNEKIVRNIEILCQFIAKNGPGFEEMARQNESGNPEFNFLFDGELGSEASCARDYYLWMKRKCGLVNDLDKGQGPRNLSPGHVDVEPSKQPNSSADVGNTHSPADSDVDMEDDITQSDTEPGVFHSNEDLKPESAPTKDVLEVHEQENAMQHSRDSCAALNLIPPVKSGADAEMKPEKSLGQPTKIDSPFRLIQGYASDDSSEEDPEPFRKEVEATAGSHEDVVDGNMVPKSGMTSEVGFCEPVKGYKESVLTKDLDDSQAVQSVIHDTMTEASLVGKYEVDDRADRVEAASPTAAFQGKHAPESGSVDTLATCKDTEKDDKKCTSTALKVDEFGRLVKEGASESESDDAHHTRRLSRRDRSRSLSRSPSDRRKRRSPRQSPHRRKDRRSRSRSWSPKRRRSRSRSPYRPGGDFGTEKARRDKVQTRECFDFLKGRCYRGASCRYMHHDPDKSESSRRHKGKPHQSSDFHGGNATSRFPREHNELKGEKMHLHQDKHDGGSSTSKMYDETREAESISNDVQPNILRQDGEVSGERDARVEQGTDEPISHLPNGEEHLISGLPSTDEQIVHQKVDASTKSDSSTIQTSTVSPGLPVSEPYPGKISNESSCPCDSKSDFPHQISHLQSPLVPSQATKAPQASNLHIDYNSMVPSISCPPQSIPLESAPPSQAPVSNQQSHYPTPPNLAWSAPPPPQPHPAYILDPSMHGAPLQFQQGSLPLRNGFPSQTSLGTHPGKFPSHSQVAGFQHQTYHLHSSNLPSQPFACPNVIRDDRFSQFPSQGPGLHSSFAPRNVPPQHVPFPGDSTVKNIQQFPGNNLLLNEPSEPTFQNNPFPQSSHLGGSFSQPGYSSDPPNRDHPSHFLDIGGSRISAHYNPYASTFDQPLSSRFCSSAFIQERDEAAGSKYGGSFSLGRAPPEGQTTAGHGSGQMMASPNSSRAGGQNLPRSGGDQYDPLHDSIEPSCESSKKHAQKQDHVAENSNVMLKLSSSHKVLDVEENNKQKEVGAVVPTMSLENDEYGETADAEVGAVENGSLSSPDGDAIVAEGEIEIDQVKPEGKSKKNKDSRSMKLFKIAVANFVKEVLKPQWRQGNMSKEVFKTIVKKTVDKVSGAMKNHRMPKSQAKIDHYIESSRRKLTQLVEGYVSKYKS